MMLQDWISGFLVAVLLAVVWLWRFSNAHLSARLSSLEQRVARLESGENDHARSDARALADKTTVAMPFTLSDATRSEIQALIRRHLLIEAIKRYRDATGCGLKEAKDAIDAMARQVNG